LSSHGKEATEFIERVVYRSLGRRSGDVKVGPGRGLDNGVIAMGEGRVMIVTVDPVSIVPAFGMELSAWLSVHLIASDLTASGVDPEYAAFSYNFPPAMTVPQKEVYVRAIGATCKDLGIAIVAGHTGTYPGGGYTVIGSGTLFASAKEGDYVTPSMAKAGDAVVVTKHAAIEAAGSLALSFPNYVKRRVGADLAGSARKLIGLCSTVQDARAAKKVGLGSSGVTSMHDATEGGILGALDEMAHASRMAFEVDANLVPVTREARAVCAAFGLDPLSTMGEGALLLTCRSGRVASLKTELARIGVSVQVIGEVKEGKGLTVRYGSGKPKSFKRGQDLYWIAYEDALRRRLG
jgi:hydrogenase expression/formation protein HypE